MTPLRFALAMLMLCTAASAQGLGEPSQLDQQPPAKKEEQMTTPSNTPDVAEDQGAAAQVASGDSGEMPDEEDQQEEQMEDERGHDSGSEQPHLWRYTNWIQLGVLFAVVVALGMNIWANKISGAATETAQAALALSEQTFEAQTRPWLDLTVRPVGAVTWNSGIASFSFQVSSKNHGNSPALRWRIYPGFLDAGHPELKFTDYIEKALQKDLMWPTADIHVGQHARSDIMTMQFKGADNCADPPPDHPRFPGVGMCHAKFAIAVFYDSIYTPTNESDDLHLDAVVQRRDPYYVAGLYDFVYADPEGGFSPLPKDVDVGEMHWTLVPSRGLEQRRR